MTLYYGYLRKRFLRTRKVPGKYLLCLLQNPELNQPRSFFKKKIRSPVGHKEKVCTFAVPKKWVNVNIKKYVRDS